MEILGSSVYHRSFLWLFGLNSAIQTWHRAGSLVGRRLLLCRREGCAVRPHTCQHRGKRSQQLRKKGNERCLLLCQPERNTVRKPCTRGAPAKAAQCAFRALRDHPLGSLPAVPITPGAPPAAGQKAQEAGHLPPVETV